MRQIAQKSGIVQRLLSLLLTLSLLSVIAVPQDQPPPPPPEGEQAGSSYTFHATSDLVLVGHCRPG